jgi:hypothetical protein
MGTDESYDRASGILGGPALSGERRVIAHLSRSESGEDALSVEHHLPDDLAGGHDVVNPADGLTGRVSLTVRVDPGCGEIPAEVEGSVAQ